MVRKKMVKKKSVIIHKPVKQQVNKINLLINFIILIAVIGLLSTFFPIIKSEILFRIKNKKEIVYIILAGIFTLIFVYHRFILPHPLTDHSTETHSANG